MSTIQEGTQTAVLTKPKTSNDYLTAAINKAVLRMDSSTDAQALTDEVQRVIADFDPFTSGAIHKLGTNSSSRIAQYSDNLLAQVKSEDLEGIGGKLQEVVILARDVNVKGLISDNKMSRIPIIGSLINKFRDGKDRILIKYDTLGGQIEKLVTEIGTTQKRLGVRIHGLEQLYALNVEEYKSLDVYIIAGEVKLEELQDEVNLRKLSPSAKDPMESQAIANLVDVTERLEKRVHDLRTMQMISVQTAPMIRMIQSNNQRLIDKFNNLQELTIPSWKKQFTLAIALLEQQKAVDLTQKIDDTTNDIMKRNAELLKLNSVQTAKANQRSVVDIDTLQQVQQSLISTIDEVSKIQKEGEQARLTAVTQMQQMKKQLADKIAA